MPAKSIKLPQPVSAMDTEEKSVKNTYKDVRITPDILVGLNGLEPSTSRLSGVRSNLLSYKPIFCFRHVGYVPTF